MEVNFGREFFLAIHVCALGHKKQTRADEAGKGCPPAFSAVWPGLQWPAATTGITLQLLGPDCNSFGERTFIHILLHLRPKQQLCISPTHIFFFISLLKCALL